MKKESISEKKEYITQMKKGTITLPENIQTQFNIKENTLLTLIATKDHKIMIHPTEQKRNPGE